jgi:hypothetical protein
VRGFARCRNASGLCRAASSASARLQNAHRGSCRSRPSSVSVVLFASKAAVPCVAARAGEAQRVARQRLAAHAATQGTRARWCRMWCCLHTLVQDVVLPSLARAYVVNYSCLQRAIKEHHRTQRTESPRKGLERQASSAKRARVDSQGGSASGVFDMYSVHMQQLTPVHTWNVCTDVPCSGEGETRCELYPCVNALYPHKTEVRRVMWLQDADDAAEGVFAREDIEACTFLLDFGELRMATAKESSGQWCGWRLRFELSTVTKTFVVKGTQSVASEVVGAVGCRQGKGQQYLLPHS